MILNITYDFNYTDKSFLVEKITDVDRNFMEKICQDSLEWKLIYYDKKNVYACLSDKDYFKDCLLFKNSMNTRFNLTIPYGLIPSMISILPRYEDQKMSKGFVQSYEDLKFVKKDESISDSYCVIKVHNKLIYPFNLRESKVIVSYHYDKKEKSVYFIFKPYLTEKEYEIFKNDKFFTKDGKKYHFLINFYMQKFTYLDDNNTLFTSYHNFKFGGIFDEISYFNNFIIKSLAKIIKKSFVKNIENNIDKIKECKEKLQTDFVGKLVEECIEEIEK